MKNTVATFKKMKNEGTKISMLTAYDYSTAKLVDEAGINSILVGDSLGMVMLGYEDTLSVTMEDMIHHTAAVARGAKNALVVGDMPFMSYEVSVEQAVINAGRLMKEGRANAVKLEGGVRVAEQIKAITKAGIPVCAHIGLTPQSVNAFGGFKGPNRWSKMPWQSRKQAHSPLCWNAFPQSLPLSSPKSSTSPPSASVQVQVAMARFWFIRICLPCSAISSPSS